MTDMDSSYDKAAMGALSGERCPQCTSNRRDVRYRGEVGNRCDDPWHAGSTGASPEQLVDIGEMRRSLFLQEPCEWNGLVRDITAQVEQSDMKVSQSIVFKLLAKRLKEMAFARQFLLDMQGSTGAEPAPECKQCAFWHDHGHKSLTKGRWSDCGHPCFLGTDKCEVCANTEPAPDWMERAAEEIAGLLPLHWPRNPKEYEARFQKNVANVLAILKKHAGGGTGK